MPGWVESELPQLPDAQAKADRKANNEEAGIVSTLEAGILGGGKPPLTVVIKVDPHEDEGTVHSATRRSPLAATGPTCRSARR